nr:MFS transporter [Pullulanibacillus pueri]
MFVVSPLLPFIASDVKMSIASTGWMVTVFSITYAVCAPIMGWLSEKSGRRFCIVLGLFLFSLANGLTALSPSFTWLMLSRLLAGISVAAVTPLIYAIISDIAPPKRRGSWLAVVISGHLTALCLGAPMGTILEQFFGWRSVFLILAAIGMVMMGVNGWVWKTVSPISNALKRTKGTRIPGIYVAVSVTAIWAIAMYAVYVYLGTGLYEENHFTSSQMAWAVSFYGLGAVTGSLSSGWLTDRFGAIRVSNTCLLLLFVALLSLGLIFTKSWLVFIFLYLWAFVGYAGFASYQARLAEEYHESRGSIMAWNNTAMYAGITLGSYIGGTLLNHVGFTSLLYISSGMAFFGFILGRFRKKSREGLR